MEIPSIGVIDPEAINLNKLCYQCSKHGPDFLFGKFVIKDFIHEPHFPERKKLILSQIQMDALFV